MSKQMIYNFTKEEKKVNKRMIYRLNGRLRVATAALLMLLLSGSYAGVVSSVSAQTMKKQTASSEGGGQKEGIKVHGHWTIDVRNPDGTLVTHREFENEFFGNHVLASILGRRSVTGLWQIILSSNSRNSPCRADSTPSSFKVQCYIFEPNSPAIGIIGNNDSQSFFTLKVNPPPNLPAVADPNVLVLTGNATAPNNGGGSIDTVTTRLGSCDRRVSAANCMSDLGFDFTSTDFTRKTIPPLNVDAGQIVQVTVTISFSSPTPS